jgi:hypothetical protein
MFLNRKKKFLEGREEVEDDEWFSCPVTVNTGESVEIMRPLV